MARLGASGLSGASEIKYPMQNLDLLIIKPGAQKKLYQDLSKSLSGLEPPLWAAQLAAFIREKGFSVKMVDAEIEPGN
ncbi:unnamed protein product, partial [marine sediment metagenome]